jgi:hypothetical protein
VDQDPRAIAQRKAPRERSLGVRGAVLFRGSPGPEPVTPLGAFRQGNCRYVRQFQGDPITAVSCRAHAFDFSAPIEPVSPPSRSARSTAQGCRILLCTVSIPHRADHGGGAGLCLPGLAAFYLGISAITRWSTTRYPSSFEAKALSVVRASRAYGRARNLSSRLAAGYSPYWI